MKMFSLFFKKNPVSNLAKNNLIFNKIAPKNYCTGSLFSMPASDPLNISIPYETPAITNQQIEEENITKMEFLNKTSKRAKRKRQKRKYGKKIQMGNM
jgi:hypothetical protein